MAGAYRPQSPDLSGLQPHSQAYTGYRPQSPDLSGLGGPNAQFDAAPQRHLLPNDYSNQYGGAHLLPKQQTSVPYAQGYQYTQPQFGMPQPEMKQEDMGFLPDASNIKHQPQTQMKAEQTDPTLGVVLKTSFPVARIKRIMQADEDIGKVAQVTPHVVSRALELFMIKLITASSEQARASSSGTGKGPRKVLVQHLKKAIEADDKFDFLAEIVSKVPDAPVKAKKDVGSDSEDAKPKKRARKKKDSD